MYTESCNYILDSFHANVSTEEYYEYSNTYRSRNRDFMSWDDYDKRDNFEEEYSERRY